MIINRNYTAFKHIIFGGNTNPQETPNEQGYLQQNVPLPYSIRSNCIERGAITGEENVCALTVYLAGGSSNHIHLFEHWTCKTLSQSNNWHSPNNSSSHALKHLLHRQAPPPSPHLNAAISFNNITKIVHQHKLFKRNWIWFLDETFFDQFLFISRSVGRTQNYQGMTPFPENWRFAKKKPLLKMWNIIQHKW